MPQTAGSTLLCDKVLEKERNTQYKESYFAIINGAINIEDMCSSAK